MLAVNKRTARLAEPWACIEPRRMPIPKACFGPQRLPAVDRARTC